MRGGGYFWKTESERESVKRKMTASSRKRDSTRRKKNASARKRRWGRFKKLAAATAIAGLGYGAYKHLNKSNVAPVAPVANPIYNYSSNHIPKCYKIESDNNVYNGKYNFAYMDTEIVSYRQDNGTASIVFFKSANDVMFFPSDAKNLFQTIKETPGLSGNFSLVFKKNQESFTLKISDSCG